MSTLSGISSWSAATSRVASTDSRRDDLSQPVVSTSAFPSTVVSLGKSVSESSGKTALQWERAGRDSVSNRMANNFSNSYASNRFNGLGSALLEQLKGGVAQLSQTVMRAPAGAGYASGVAVSTLHGMGDSKVSLSVVTKSGVEVKLSLDSDDDGLAVQMTANGELSDAETQALGSLAKGFQEAIDGITQEPAQLNLGGLMQFDAKVLSSVNLQAKIALSAESAATQSLSFQADATQRKVSFSGAAGSIDIKVDTSQLASLGSAQQQARALQVQLQQFDKAATRGHADAAMMDMFKQTFSSLHGSIASDATLSTSGAAPSKWALAAEERSLLTGLADFSASVSQTPAMINPMRLSEQDAFAYSVSQSTSVGGRSYDDRAISQQQSSTLTASYHMPLVAGTALRLTTAAESQNYTYHQIDDSATSEAKIGYKDGKLASATLEQSTSLSSRVSTYVMGKLKSDITTPDQHRLLRDLVGALSPYQPGDAALTTEKRAEQRQTMLQGINDSVFLRPY
ncbi:hypothetical protein [Janthinobacterium aquaticum]|uniref:hypothetical protein n=1 Tax=Janthinobacterium sp. FT58W TaxID=2654254 RepID=UPI0012656A1B|nr:hypothetical protein [Janthinobacterium sp. FT58W]KAB8044643.1 hypothetical protein GCM43_05470 [Janthinobacterium sp. FT58W]